MRNIDVKKIEEVWPQWAKSESLSDVKNICALSPDHSELELLNRLFPNAFVSTHDRNSWDLNDVLRSQFDKTKLNIEFDLTVASAVFMCSPNPKLWFDNVMSSSRHLWVLDHILAWRTKDAECATHDGDVMRYTYKEHVSRVPWAFDLESLDYKKEFVVYDVPTDGPPAKSFLGFISRK